jgi:hypothetical protein
MTMNESSTSALDYSEAFIRMQHLHRDLQKQLLAKDYVQARELARAVAIEAMHIGIWCRQFIDTTERESS